ncbi:hypothetical protein [Arthrobacter mobilis]|uniref:Uncharacterized protein n=1 Tax=Arthrobacter mobilis TaxID=2724944 RepID=A0A7X6HE88_9MICC|nr:hypothetical protein [Arthrobacter mobilis]NKX54644.1 hypothetical protein [Arthrobacter mobilis]
MGTFIWTLTIAAGAALAWRLTHKSGQVAANSSAAGTVSMTRDTAAAAASGSPAAIARTAVPDAAEEPIDGWTYSAADTAATDPPVEDQYIEDIAVAPHATPIDPGSEPSPWRIRKTAPASPAEPAPAGNRPDAGQKGTQMQDKGREGNAADGKDLPQDAGYDESEWDGDEGERLVDPDARDGEPRD